MRDFLAIPAIDLLGGNCVRLERGDYAKSTAYGSDPAAWAMTFARAGAKRLHVVDLDGARDGKCANIDALNAIAKSLAAKGENKVEIEFGGGLRSMAAVERALKEGADYCVVGTAAISNPDFLREATTAFPGKIILGLDARGGRLAVHGWTETTSVDAVEFAKQAERMGIAGIIHTDIDRDGILEGPNLDASKAIAAKVSCPVYLSGGIATLADVEHARTAGLSGAIIGKALYSKQFTAEALFATPTA